MTYYKDLQKCFQWLDKIIIGLDEKGEINKSLLFIQTQNSFPVSIKALEKRLKLYETAGMIEIKGNLLKKPKV